MTTLPMREHTLVAKFRSISVQRQERYSDGWSRGIAASNQCGRSRISEHIRRPGWIGSRYRRGYFIRSDRGACRVLPPTIRATGVHQPIHSDFRPCGESEVRPQIHHPMRFCLRRPSTEEHESAPINVVPVVFTAPARRPRLGWQTSRSGTERRCFEGGVVVALIRPRRPVVIDLVAVP